ncbi:MAG: hypothetical protein J6Y02_21505 [Pseudobutyrivibrio sp.]|nr:hypothetical protein [Pseudobutyrivibrio sp.]
MTREQIMLWLEHLANRETVPECREALETASWIIYGCSEDDVESYSVIVAKPALTRVLLAEGKSIDEIKMLLELKERGKEK